MNQVVPDWLDKPIISINRELIAKRHAQHGETKSKARSNNAMRVLRAIFNFAVHEPFTIHDLRRTFATTAEGLDLPAYALKRLLIKPEMLKVVNGAGYWNGRMTML